MVLWRCFFLSNSNKILDLITFPIWVACDVTMQSNKKKECQSICSRPVSVTIYNTPSSLRHSRKYNLVPHKTNSQSLIV